MAKIPLRRKLDLAAGVLLLLQDWGAQKKLPLPKSEAAILALTGARREDAYEMRDRLRAQLPYVVGRPSNEEAQLQVREAALAFLFHHPGAARLDAEGCKVFNCDYQRFVVGLAETGSPGVSLSTAELANCTGVPQTLVEEWLRGARAARGSTPIEKYSRRS